MVIFLIFFMQTCRFFDAYLPIFWCTPVDFFMPFEIFLVQFDIFFRIIWYIFGAKKYILGAQKVLFGAFPGKI